MSDHLTVRGHPGSNNTVIAIELVRASPSTTVVLQGPVDSTENPSLEIPGVTVDTSSILARIILFAFIPAAAYSAEVATSATKAGSYGVFGEGE